MRRTAGVSLRRSVVGWVARLHGTTVVFRAMERRRGRNLAWKFGAPPIEGGTHKTLRHAVVEAQSQCREAARKRKRRET